MRSAAWQGDWPVTQPWGPTTLTVEPMYQGQHWHVGIDIGMWTGTPLYALAAAKVTVLSYGVLGLQISGRTETHFYVHIDRAVVAFGQMVAAGELVAYSGAKVPSGGSLTGPHLHFEVQTTSGLNVPPGFDPLPYLTAAFGPGGGTIGSDLSQADSDGIRFLQFGLAYKPGTIPSGDPLKAPGEAFILQARANLADIIAEELAKLPPAGGGVQPPEPGEPTTITLKIDSVPGTATGTIT